MLVVGLVLSAVSAVAPRLEMVACLVVHKMVAVVAHKVPVVLQTVVYLVQLVDIFTVVTVET